MKLKGLIGIVAAGCIALAGCAEFGKLQKQLDHKGEVYYRKYEKATVITSLRTDEDYVIEKGAINYLKKTQMILNATHGYTIDKGFIVFSKIYHPLDVLPSIVAADKNWDNTISKEEASNLFERVYGAYIGDVLDFNILDGAIY